MEDISNGKRGRRHVREKEALSHVGKSERVMLNISGEIYETRIKTLLRFPETLLGNRNKMLFCYCKASGQYFFHRNKLFFDAILYFYQSNGILRCPHGISVSLFEEECRFFQLPEDAIFNLKAEELRTKKDESEDNDNAHHTVKSRLWDLMQNPETSTTAKYFAVFSQLMVALSVVLSCVESLPSLKLKNNLLLQDNYLAVSELTLNSWFLLELVVSSACTPNMKTFLKSTLTWIDIIAILPYFIVLIATKNEVSSFAFLRIMRLARVARLLRLSKQSERIQIVASVLKSSVDELKVLLMCLTIAVIFGGSVMYYLEVGTNGELFSSIPEGAYWGLQTMTTVGYGDVVPMTIEGKLFAGAFMIMAAITLCIPVLSIIAKFAVVYKKHFATSF